MLVLKNAIRNVCFSLLLIWAPTCVFGYVDTSAEVIEDENVNLNLITENDIIESKHKRHKKVTYYLYIDDFINSFIEIPTSNVSGDSTTISSKYLAGRAPIYNAHDEKAGICSASFLCMQNQDGIFTDISNYLSIDNGLILYWLTPTTLINLELDSIIHSMVTECLVVASTKIGFNPYYGKKFNMVVSSDDEKIYFKLRMLN